MLYDIGTNPGQRLPVGNIEPLFKPTTSHTDKKSLVTETQGGSKPGTSDSKRSQVSLYIYIASLMYPTLLCCDL